MPTEQSQGAGEENQREPEPKASSEPATEKSPNRAPVPILVADAVQGRAPLNVSFAIDAADPDGDAVLWSLDVDGDGTADHEGETLPAQAHYEYPEGVHRATLRVSDGDLEDSMTLNITVDRALVPETWALMWPSDGQVDCLAAFMTQNGTSDIACTDPKQPAALVLVTGDQGSVWYEFPADAKTGGLPAGSLATFNVTVNSTGMYQGNLSVELLADDAVVAAGKVPLEAAPAAPHEANILIDMDLAREIPAGAMLTARFAFDTVGPVQLLAGYVSIRPP